MTGHGTSYISLREFGLSLIHRFYIQVTLVIILLEAALKIGKNLQLVFQRRTVRIEMDLQRVVPGRIAMRLCKNASLRLVCDTTLLKLGHIRAMRAAHEPA